MPRPRRGRAAHPLEDQVERRRRREHEDRRRHEPPDQRVGERVPDRRIRRLGEEHQRKEPEHRGRGGHQDWAHAFQRAPEDRVEQLEPGFQAHAVDVVHEQDGVVHDDPPHHDHPDVRLPGEHRPDEEEGQEHPDQRHRHREEHAQGLPNRLEEPRRDHEDQPDRHEEDQPELGLRPREIRHGVRSRIE
jgi:hypothetical protein